MALEFGHIPVKIRGVVYYTLTAFEQKCWIHFLSRSVPTGIRGVTKCTLQGLPAIVSGIWCMIWAPKAYKKSVRKDPTLYENDE